MTARRRSCTGGTGIAFAPGGELRLVMLELRKKPRHPERICILSAFQWPQHITLRRTNGTRLSPEVITATREVQDGSAHLLALRARLRSIHTHGRWDARQCTAMHKCHHKDNDCKKWAKFTKWRCTFNRLLDTS
jgi:hypothetical protein